jgi:hypothetical protein
MNKPYRYIIGIDPGTKTGVAVWDRDIKDFALLGTFSLIQAFVELKPFISSVVYRFPVLMRCENPNTWRPFNGRNDKAAASRIQGAGSVKRDFAIWKEIADYYTVPFEPVSLQSSQKKVSADYFKKLTGIEKRTSEHARDAAMMVFKY